MVPDGLKGLLPYFASGTVVKGFGRGSKQLGCPTANFPVEIVKSLPPGMPTGVYYGWAQVDRGPVYKMVMSIGYNPHFKNTIKTMETHILHKFTEDFYGSLLRVVLTGYIREMASFTTLDALMTAINDDISTATHCLDTEPEQSAFQQHSYFFKNHEIDGEKELNQKAEDIMDSKDLANKRSYEESWQESKQQIMDENGVQITPKL